jgi:hypothetical protein
VNLSRRHLLGLFGAAAMPAGLRATTTTHQILLVDPALPTVQLRAGATLHPAAQLVPIEGDIVRLWRSGLGAQIAAAPGRTVAIMGYDKAMLLAGLAREDRIAATQRRLSGRAFQVAFGQSSIGRKP